jgi:hypothetical protein
MAYINNQELLTALLESHAQGRLTTECYTMFEDIVKQRINVFLVYNKETHFEAMLDSCVHKLTRIWHSFKFENDNPFAYFVSITDNAIRLYFMKNQIQYTSIEQQNEKYKDND